MNFSFGVPVAAFFFGLVDGNAARGGQAAKQAALPFYHACERQRSRHAHAHWSNLAVLAVAFSVFICC